ncbi:hypothetical protein L204_104280 [Cryptococcus depauperatus]
MPASSRHPPSVHHYGSKTSAKLKLGGSKAPVQHLPVGEKNIYEDAEVEDFGPPTWRTVLHKQIDFGFPDFYPSRPGHNQPEDVLTEENVKSGFSGRPFVSEVAETFSMHGPIHQHLSSGCLDMLMNLGKELIEKQEESMPQIGERTFRIPVRVTYNDTKRLQFLSDLANPAVPLYRLMRTPVPHGFKGVEILDAMFSPATSIRQPASNMTLLADPIPIDRAVWFIRVIGANEISVHRTRQSTITSSVTAPSPVAATPSSTTTVNAASPMPVSSNEWYSQEFTNTLIQWLRIQLGQLALPPEGQNTSASTTSKNLGSGILQDEKARAKWLIKWDYSTRLLREMHAKNLLSNRLFSGWLAEHLSQVNLAQLGFLAQLVGEYLSDMIRHLDSARHCIRAACERLTLLRESPVRDVLGKVEVMLVIIIKSLYEANPDVLLSPVTWKRYSPLISSIIRNTTSQWTNLQRRNEALLFKPKMNENPFNPRRQQMEEITKLDSISENTNMLDLTRSYFDGASAPNIASLNLQRLEEKIFMLLDWAMGLFQLGSHRPYATYTLLKHWQGQHKEYQARQSRPDTVDLFEILYKWLDTASAARDESNIEAIGITIGEMIRRGMFSYGRYLQTLIAAGQSARNRAQQELESHHLTLLKVMPTFVLAKELLHQRRIALSGDDEETRKKDDGEEEAILDAFKEDVKEYIPEIFGLETYGRSEELRQIVDYHLPSTSQMTRYLYVFVRPSIAISANAIFSSQAGRSPMNASTFARITQVFRQCHGYATIADFMIRALLEAEDDDILDVVLDVIQRDADIWTSMDLWPRLGDKLLDRHHILESRGKEHVRLVKLLRNLVQKNRLMPDDQEEVKHLSLNIVRSPHSENLGLLSQDPLEILPQILLSGNEDIISTIAPALHHHYGFFHLWSSKWWTLIIDVIQKAESEQKLCLYRMISKHMIAVFQEYQESFDSIVGSWLSSFTSARLLDIFGNHTSKIMTQLLLFLVSHRALSTTTIFDKMIYPIWKLTLMWALPPRKRLSSEQIQSIVSTIDLVSQLLVLPPLESELPPTLLTEAIVIQASRQNIFHDHHVKLLIQHMPVLVVFEQNQLLPEQTTTKIGEILNSLASSAEFKTAAFRHLSILKDAFLAREWSGPGMDQELEGRMVDVLKLIMSEKRTQSSPRTGIPSIDEPGRFSAWQWTRIVLEMRLEFKALAMRIADGQEVVDAKCTLSQLVHLTLDRETNRDDTDLLCEVFRGVDTTITHEIIAAGMDRLSNLLGQAIGAETQQQLEAFIDSIHQILRIVHCTSRESTQPITESSVLIARHKLLDLLAVALQTIDRHMTTGADFLLPQGISPPQPGHLLAIVMALLKFVLGTDTTDNGSLTAPKPNFPHLAVCFLKAIVASETIHDPDWIKEMCDMLVYIIDCTPFQSRLACQAILSNEIALLNTQSGFNFLPLLTSSILSITSIQRNMSLTTPDTIDDDTHNPSLLLDDRRWELFEYMAPPKRKIGPQDLFLSSITLKDHSSIPISLFSPRLTRNAPPNVGTMDIYDEAGEDDKSSLVLTFSVDEPEGQWRNFASERDLGVGFAGEPTWAKLKATKLYSLDKDDEDCTVLKEFDISTALSQPRKNQKHAKGRYINERSSNDSITTNLENKDESDLEEPLAKKQKTTSATASKTSGKAPARRAAGGKSVPRKATGGKTTREGVSNKTKAGRKK